MPRVKFVETDGTEHQIEVIEGQTLMEAAVANLIPGIEGDCGGLCACGTCHVYVSDDWHSSTGEPDELEKGILEFAFGVDARSRLACQLHMTGALEGLVLYLPERQY